MGTVIMTIIIASITQLDHHLATPNELAAGFWQVLTARTRLLSHRARVMNSGTGCDLNAQADGATCHRRAPKGCAGWWCWIVRPKKVIEKCYDFAIGKVAAP
jgi:hypothetical protein